MSESRLKRRSSSASSFGRRLSVSEHKSVGRCQRAICRRNTDPQKVAAVWSAIRHIRIGRQVPNFDRISRYLLREHEIETSDARKLLRRMSVEKLVVCYTSVNVKGENAGAEQDGYRLPALEEDEVERKVNTHDWYCFQCHQGGEILKCTTCWRVYHPACCESQSSQMFTCPNCEEQKKQSLAKSNLKQIELHRFLEFAFSRMKEKAKPLYRLGVAEDDDENLLKRRFLLFHLCDLEMIETNMNEHKYQTLQEFRDDAAIIKHNAYIWFGGESPEAKIGDVILADCDYELEQIQLCCDCYWSSNTKPKNWFSLPCRQPHEIVLAKHVGWPFWPAKVMKVLPNGYDVRFFGAGHHRASVPANAVKPITGSPRLLKLNASASKRYHCALQELAMFQKLMPVLKVEQTSCPSPIQPPDIMVLETETDQHLSDLKKESTRFADPSCKKALLFKPSSTRPKWRSSYPFRRKRGRLMSCEKASELEEKAEILSKWKRKRSPTPERLVLEISPISGSCTATCSSQTSELEAKAEVPSKSKRKRSLTPERKRSLTPERLVLEISPISGSCTATCSSQKFESRIQIPPVAVKANHRDQSIQVDVVCYNCQSHFDAAVRAVKFQLDEALKHEVDSFRKRMIEEYEADKHRAVERILSCTQRESNRVSSSINEVHKKQHADLMRQVDLEHKARLAELKKKQWCANCENEAAYYCCWGTSYCTVKCQRKHWEQHHYNVCRHKATST